MWIPTEHEKYGVGESPRGRLAFPSAGRAGAPPASLPPRPSRPAGCECLSPACLALRARAAGSRPRGVECAPASRRPPPKGPRAPAGCGLCTRSSRGAGARVSSWRRAEDGVPLPLSPSPAAAVGRGDLPNGGERRNRTPAERTPPEQGKARTSTLAAGRVPGARMWPRSPVTARAGPAPSPRCAPPSPSSSLPPWGAGGCVLGAGAPVPHPPRGPPGALRRGAGVGLCFYFWAPGGGARAAGAAMEGGRAAGERSGGPGSGSLALGGPGPALWTG